MKRILVVTCVAVCVGLCGWAARTAWNNRDGRCVLLRPWGEAKGCIVSAGGGLLGSDTPQYWLSYPGVGERSGEACQVEFVVTEREYERVMYGYESKGGER